MQSLGSPNLEERAMSTERFVDRLFSTLGEWFASLPKPSVEDSASANQELTHV